MKTLGDNYEEKASLWLLDQGWHIEARNYRAKPGEIDIIARDATHLVFIEVRARSHAGYAGAAASVTRSKQRKILQTAQCFLQGHPNLAQLPCRFDVIAFEPRQSPAGIHWIRSAFTA